MNDLRTTVRAKSLITGKYIKGAYFDGYILEGSMIEANEEYCVVEQWTPVDKNTVGIFTGTYDKNNVPIFEGHNVEVYVLDLVEKGTVIYNEWNSPLIVDDNGNRLKGLSSKKDVLVKVIDKY